MKKLSLIVLLAGSLSSFAQDGTSVSASTGSSEKITAYVSLVEDCITNGHAGDAKMLSLADEIKCLLTEDQAMEVDRNLVKPNVRKSLCNTDWPEVITVSKDDLTIFRSNYTTYNKKFPSTSSAKGAAPAKTVEGR